jgi:hypothetical protein
MGRFAVASASAEGRTYLAALATETDLDADDT